MCQRANAQKNDENHGEPAMLGSIDAGCPASRRRQPSVPDEEFKTGTPNRRENYQDGHPVAQDQCREECDRHDPKATRATASDYAISAADDVIARRMPLSDARFGFRKKIERSPPIGHVGLDLTIRCTAECECSVGHGVNDRCNRRRLVGRHHRMAGIGIADVLERPRVIVRLQTATRDFRELE